MNWGNGIAKDVIWTNEISNIEQKQKVAHVIADKVKNGDIIGIGSGSTATLALKEIGKKVKEEKLSILAIPTSFEMMILCTNLGITTTTLINKKPDWVFDGADEVDSMNNLIKGRGGALFKEKLVLSSSLENYILVDDSKLVSTLGEKFPVPVEVFPYAINIVETRLETLGVLDIALRMGKGKDGPVITESGNFIIDVKFKKIESEFEKEIKSIPGVIESGLFIGPNYNLTIIKG